MRKVNCKGRGVQCFV